VKIIVTHGFFSQGEEEEERDLNVIIKQIFEHELPIERVGCGNTVKAAVLKNFG
jgi:hypothetical protein